MPEQFAPTRGCFLFLTTTVNEAINIVIREDFDFTFFVSDFSSLESNISNCALEAIGLNDYRVADTELIFDNNGNASDKIFNHILEGEADDGSHNS